MDIITYEANSVAHDGTIYNRATDTLNEALQQEDGFYMWIDLPDGTQFQVPKGSMLRTLNYVITTVEK